MKKKLIIITIPIILISLFIIKYSINKNNIDAILKSTEYSYLPKNAQNYIKKVYEKTGKVLLTEKNKKENEPYLNPDYVEYLENGESSEYGYIPEEFTIDHKYKNDITKKTNESTDKQSLSYYNLRNEGYITNIYDQGSEGICWAFASTTSLESHIAIESGKSKMLVFSEKQVDYATTKENKSIDINKNPYLYDNQIIGNDLNEGGNAIRYINSTALGISPQLCDGNCSDGTNYNKNKTITDKNYWKYNYNFNSKLSPYEVWNTDSTQYSVDESLFYNSLTTDNEEEVNSLVNLLKEQIVNNGSLSVTVGAYSNLSVSYIPSSTETPLNTNGRNIIYYVPTGWNIEMNHAVSIIGWDDNYTHNICLNKNNFEITNATKSGTNYTCSSGTLHTINGAWIIQNSWGNSNTFIYLPYNTMKSSYNSISGVSEKDYDNSYRAVSSSNAFNKGNNSEKIKKIKFFISAYDRDINIMYDEEDNEIIVKDNSYIIPIKGTVLKTIHYTQPGLYTVDLSQENIIIDENANNIKYSLYGSYVAYDYYASLHTDNVGNDKMINITNISKVDEGILSKCNLNDNKCIDEPHEISFDDNNAFIIYGVSRNLTSESNLTFKVYDYNDNDVTNKFHIFRNFSVSNYINAIISYNSKNVQIGNYRIEVYYNNIKYSEYEWNLTKHNNEYDGIGTKDNPYIIKTNNELNNIRNHFNINTNKISGSYRLDNDLDLTYDTTNPSGAFYNSSKGWEPINNFEGSFDGNNHLIEGLTINRTLPEDNNVGLFGNISGNENYIKNIIIKDANILGNSYSSALIGKITNARNISIHDIAIIDSKIDSSQHTVGGIIGYISATDTSNMTIYNLFSNSTIGSNNTDKDVGGLIGNYSITTINQTHNLTLTDIVNTGMVSGKSKVGGIIGKIYDPNNITIKNTISVGKYQSNESTTLGDVLGTFVMENTFNLNNNYYKNKLYNFNYNGTGTIYNSNNNKIEFKDIVTNNAINNFVHKNDWTYPVIDGIKRIPMLKSMIDYYDFTEKIEDFELNMLETKNIYDLIKPNHNKFKDIEYTYDNNYLNINNQGLITPLKPGITTLHINSLYDGYEDDIQVKIIQNNTVTYYSNNNEDKTITQQISSNENFNLQANTFNYKGYKFKCWNTLPNGTGTEYSNEQLITGETFDNLQLYAQWEQIEYKINFYNGDSFETQTYTYPSDGKITLNTHGYTKENYILENWNTSKNGNGTKILLTTIEFDSLPFDENNELNIYAIWKEITDIINNTTDTEVIYDGKNHSLNINLNIQDYSIKYSVNNKDYNLTANPSFKEVGEYLINYKVTKLGYNDLIDSNKIKIYGIRGFDSTVTLKNNILITNNNSFSTLQDKADIYSKTNYKTHLNSENDIITTNNIKTGDKLKININNEKNYTYSIAYLGDVNGDGTIGIIDYIRIMKDIMGNSKLSGAYYEAADMNRNNSVDIIDYIRVMKIIMEDN